MTVTLVAPIRRDSTTARPALRIVRPATYHAEDWTGPGSDGSAARAEADAARERLSLLEQAMAALLATTSGVGPCLDRLLTLAIPRLADWCTVLLVDEDGVLRQAVAAHVDPLKEVLARQLQHWPLPGPDTAADHARLATRGTRSRLLPHITDELLDGWALAADQLALIRAIGPKSCMLVPIVVREQTAGMIAFAVGEESGRDYGASDLRLAEALGHCIALAFENVRLQADAQAALLQEQAARRELQRTENRIITADERLRREIAELLHGAVQTRLLVAWHQLGQCEQLIPDDPSAAQALLARVRAEVDRIRDQEVRRASQALHPAIVRLGLVPAIRSLVERFESGFAVDLDIDPDLRALDGLTDNMLPEPLRLAVYRVAEEALGNVYRHAGASAVRISLAVVPGPRLQIVVADNGRGFDTERSVQGLGHSSIAGRVAQFDGIWSITSAPGRGTTVMASLALPLPALQSLQNMDASTLIAPEACPVLFESAVVHDKRSNITPQKENEMFLSPNFTLIGQANNQVAINANVLALGGTQSNSQTASNSANVTNVGVIAI